MAQEIKTPALADAQAMARKYPETFFVPSASALEGLQRGDMVKIGTVAVGRERTERFWCGLVRRAEDGEWIGKVSNHLVLTQQHGLAFGDLVKFGTDAVHQIDGDEEDSIQ